MAGVKGDFGKVADLVQRMTKLGSRNFRLELNEKLGAGGLALIILGFEKGQDPYGKPWKPTSSRDGQTLVNRAILKNSYHFAGVKPEQFQVASNAPFVGVHQYGAVIRPKNGKALRFKLPYATQVFRKDGKGKLSKTKTLSQWVYAQKVTIPARPMVPEGTLGPIWTKMVNDEVEAAVLELMDLH